MSAQLREETREQQARATAAADELDTALARLADEAKAARRRIGTRPKPVDLSAVFGAFRSVERAEQNHDIALADLATASGADA